MYLKGVILLYLTLQNVGATTLNYCGALDKGVKLSTAVLDEGAGTILVLGGVESYYGESGHAPLDQVVRFDTATEQDQIVGNFPAYVHAGASATTSNGTVYYFGGGGWLIPYSRDSAIYRFSLDDPNPKLIATRLPVGTNGLSAVSTGQDIYLFGGQTDTLDGLSQILKFDTRDETIEEVVTQLPQNVTQNSAVWDGQYVYLFGGVIQEPAKATDQVVRFDPATNSIEIIAPMASKLFGTNAVLVGDWVYLISGQLSGSSQPEFLTLYNIKTGQTYVENVAGITEYPNQSSAAYTNGYIYIFGGDYDGSGDIICLSDLVAS